MNSRLGVTATTDMGVACPPRLARMAGRHAHLRGLATVIHEISGLGQDSQAI
jgi:hypothetical protein